MSAGIAVGSSEVQAKGKAKAVDGGETASADVPTHLLLLGSAAISGHSSCLGNLQWAANGQALVVTRQNLFILTPGLGLHPQLLASHKLPRFESHPSYSDRFEQLVQQIDYRSFHDADPTVRTRSALAKDHTAPHPALLEHSWRSAEWSPGGIGASGSSFILALGHELDLYVIGASKDPYRSEWNLVSPVDPSPVRDRVAAEFQPGPGSIFAPNDNKLRRESRALEINRAVWSEALPPGPEDSYNVEALIAAGTRSGHLAFWHCSTQRPVPTYVGCHLAGAWEVLRICIGPWTKGVGDSGVSCYLASQDRDRISVWTVKYAEGQVTVSSTANQPRPFANRMISSWRWIGNMLVYATTGQLILFDPGSAKSTTFQLDDGGRDSCDPLQPAIDIRPLDRTACAVTLQDASCYRLPLSVGGDGTQTLSPLPAPEVRGYHPILEAVEKEYEALQRLYGTAVEPSATSSAHALMAMVRAEEPLAAAGFNVSGTSRYSLLLQTEARLPPEPSERAAALLSAALQSDQHASVATVARIRHVFAHLFVSTDRKSFADGLFRVVQSFAKGSEASIPGGRGQANDEQGASALRRSRTALYAAQWLQREQPGLGSELDAVLDALKSGLFRRHLADSVGVLLGKVEAASTLEPSEQRNDVETCVRLSAAIYTLSKGQSFEQSGNGSAEWTETMGQAQLVLSRLGVSFDQLQPGWDASLQASGSIETTEACAACHQKLSLRIDAKRSVVEWASCPSGHVWREWKQSNGTGQSR